MSRDNPSLIGSDENMPSATRVLIGDCPMCKTPFLASFVFMASITMEQNAMAQQRGDDIMVMPIDDATAGCLGPVRVGEEMTVQPTGAIKRKGRSR
jgi:hypothetical protein